MDNNRSAVPWNRFALVVTPVLALWFPILELFRANSLPLMTVPSWVFLGGIAAVGLILGAAASRLMPVTNSGRTRQVLFVCVLALIVLATLDVAIGGHKILNAMVPATASPLAGRLLRLLTLGGVIAVIAAVLWVIRRHAATLLFVFSVVAFGATLVSYVSPFLAAPKPAAATGKVRTDAPPLVYIILDEGMGVEGLNAAPGGAPTARAFRSLFERHGFRLYGNAFSRHFVSGRSIPNALNFDFVDNSWGPVLRYQRKHKVTSSLFDRLWREGYEVVSYGTKHIDLCFDKAARCEILPSFNPFSPYITNDEMRSAALFQVLRYARSSSYLIYNYTSFHSSRYDTTLPSAFSAFDSYAFPRWFDKFTDDVASSPRGRAYFAHILAPHSPYVLDRNCVESGRADVGYFLTEQHELRGEALDQERVRQYQAYYEQCGCLVKKLDALLTRLDHAPAFKDATIVVHGDHGSRISAGQYNENLSARDLVDNFSALYAVRRPGIEPAYDVRSTSVQRLTAEYFSGLGAEKLGPDNRTIAVDSKEPHKVVVRPAPDFSKSSKSSPQPLSSTETR